MAYNHISHDTVLFDSVILSNCTQIGGHTQILQGVNIGLNTTIHQKSTVGTFSMIGMGSVISRDIPPFLTAMGIPAKPIKLNEFGLRRNGFMDEEISLIREIYKEQGKQIASKDYQISGNSKIDDFFLDFFKCSNRKISSLDSLQL
jgi:UDP-N-acetylglucosamine acyltransferase